MYYSTKIDDYLDAIKDCESFFVAEREQFKIINYINMGVDIFPNPLLAPDEKTKKQWFLRRECRGLIFSLTGDVISLPIRKFFNVNEREETLIDNIDFSRPHVILEKLDGSMIRPILINNTYRLGTKMGITDVSLQVEVWVKKHTNYDQFIKDCIDKKICPQFEWCSRKQKIVIDYPVDRLVLLSIRDLITGKDWSMLELKQLASIYNIDVVLEYTGSIDNMKMLVSTTKELTDQEGWILKFDDVSYKIKSDDYVMKHRAKDSILRENGVLELLLDEKLDDIKSLLSDKDRINIENFEKSFWEGVKNTSKKWEASNLEIKSIEYITRKWFALNLSSTVDEHLRSAIFKSWDIQISDINWLDHVLSTIRKNISTQTKVDNIRYLWGNAKWTFADLDD